MRKMKLWHTWKCREVPGMRDDVPRGDRYKGWPELKIEEGLPRPSVEKLLVGRRGCTKPVDDVLKLVEVVRNLVPDVSVTGGALLRRGGFALDRCLLLDAWGSGAPTKTAG
ncbi:hypothetical protein [Sinomonas gamaensis]|uniref:hypothetical protein n=1 Tax=Sinomonas gamaensis TaxID=2565624 RepID=UPI001107DAD2|nr:hypothetical protein [Sinomonas gamaensis]